MVFEGLSFDEKIKFDKKIADTSFKDNVNFWLMTGKQQNKPRDC